MDIVLRLHLAFPVTNTSGVRSFSKVKIIKNRLRSTIGQERLNHSTPMSLKRDLVRKLDFSDLVKNTDAKASREVHMFSMCFSN